ncbi:MAG: hypothetical protein DCF20_16445 [Pseudanabaena sp.]|nr:MAG: hypothetical protein DCF20_16445 [Pseudanabaena sp.]
MSKASQDLEKAIANVAKVGTCLPQNLPEWMQRIGILPEDIIVESTKVGNSSPNNKTDVLIKFQKSKPLKISAKLSNAGYFANWYGHERFISEFGRKVFEVLTTKTSVWANDWANKPNASLFVGVSISFGKRTGNTLIPFLDVFEDLEDLKKIVCGVGDDDRAANCPYVSDKHPNSLEEMIDKLAPLDLETIKELSKDIKVIFRPINPLTESSNRGKNVYTKFQPDQPLSQATEITALKNLMKLGKFVNVFPNKLNHNHILDTLEADYKIHIERKKSSKRISKSRWQFYLENET